MRTPETEGAGFGRKTGLSVAFATRHCYLCKTILNCYPYVERPFEAC